MPRIRMSLMVEVEVDYAIRPPAIPGIDRDGRPTHPPEDADVEIGIIHLIDPAWPGHPFTLPYQVTKALVRQQAGAIEEACLDAWDD